MPSVRQHRPAAVSQAPEPTSAPSVDALLRQNAGACICGNLRMAARLVTSHYDAALRPHGIEANQMIMMWIAFASPDVAAREIARIAGMDQSTASRNLAVLESRGLVRCSQDREDRRARRIALTPAGRRTLRAAYPDWERAQREVNAIGAELGDMTAVGLKLRKLTRRMQSGRKQAVD